MKNTLRNIILFVSFFFIGASLAFALTFGIMWFRSMSGNACDIPGWGWCKWTTGLTLSAFFGSLIAFVGELTMKIWKNEPTAEVMKMELAGIAEVFGAGSFLFGFPTAIWWGLFLA